MGRASIIPKNLERQLRIATFFEHIAESTSGLEGEAFFRELVREIASILNVRHASISRYPGKTSGHFRTVACFAAGLHQPNMEIEIEGRPCKYVIE